MKASLVVVSVVLFLILSTAAFAGWEVTYLDSPGYPETFGTGISGTQQVGWSNSSSSELNYWHALLWNGTRASKVDLNPTGSSNSKANDVYNGKQVGFARSHACIWSGTAASCVDLNPAVSTSSQAYGIYGNQQVGEVRMADRKYHASLWYGTADSWIDLHPTGCNESHAFDTSGDQQVGYVDTTYLTYHASLWRGTAASWVDLNPAGSLESYAYGISDGQQVGYARLGYHQAGIWSGTAASWVNLNPSTVHTSYAYGISHGYQVGAVITGGGRYHASLWNGTASSWVDLHSFLAPNYSNSGADAIQVVGNDVWVVGSAYNSNWSCNEAVLWHNVIPEPSCLLALGTGLLALAEMIRRRRNG